MITEAQRTLCRAILQQAQVGNPDLDPTTYALISVLGSVVEGVPIEKAIGAPGRWGYDTPIGDAVLAYLREKSETQAAAATHAESAHEHDIIRCLSKILNRWTEQYQDLSQIKASSREELLLLFLVGVFNEVGNGRAKFPESDHLIVALTKEVGEVAKALLEERIQRVIQECAQVAAVAARIATEGDASLLSFRLTGGLDVPSYAPLPSEMAEA